MVQLSHPYMTTGKTIALTRWTFVGKIISLLFNMLSRLVIAFLPRSKRLLISWLQSLPEVIWEPKNIKLVNLSQSQSLFQWVSSSHQVAKVLELQLQYQSFQWVFRTDFLWDWLGWSICSPWDSQESSPAPQFKSINSLALSLLYSPALMDIYIHTYIHIYVYIWSMNAHSYCYFNNIYCSYTHNVLIYWHFNTIGYRGKG